MMRGSPGTKVKLEVFRKDERATHTFALVREQIKIQGVKAKMVEPGISFIRVRTFNETTVADVARVLTEQNAQTPLKGVVLDLRNNPGGLLDAAVGLSAMFLPKDAMVVYTEGRMEGSKTKFSPAAITTPVVVAIHSPTCRNPEDRTGGGDDQRRLGVSLRDRRRALQDHKRATIMGTTTFGKGSVQNIIPLSQTTGVNSRRRATTRRTAARFRAPVSNRTY